MCTRQNDFNSSQQHPKGVAPLSSLTAHRKVQAAGTIGGNTRNLWGLRMSQIQDLNKKLRAHSLMWVTNSESTYHLWKHSLPWPLSFVLEAAPPVAARVCQSLSASTWPYCLCLAPEEARVRCPNSDTPQENYPLCQAYMEYGSLQLPGISFNQSSCFGAHFTRPSGFADINAGTMKTPLFTVALNGE